MPEQDVVIKFGAAGTEQVRTSAQALRQALAAVELEMTSLRQQMAALRAEGKSDSMAGLRQQMADLKVRAAALRVELQKFRVEGTDPIQVSSNAAAFALTNMGRTLEDASFGFRDLRLGVLAAANNIAPLVQSLIQARVAAAATGTTLAASLAGSLFGPGGLILGFSLMSAALQALPALLGKTAEKASDAAGSLRDVAREALNVAAATQAQLQANLTRLSAELQELQARGTGTRQQTILFTPGAPGYKVSQTGFRLDRLSVADQGRYQELVAAIEATREGLTDRLLQERFRQLAQQAGLIIPQDATRTGRGRGAGGGAGRVRSLLEGDELIGRFGGLAPLSPDFAAGGAAINRRSLLAASRSRLRGVDTSQITQDMRDAAEAALELRAGYEAAFGALDAGLDAAASGFGQFVANVVTLQEGFRSFGDVVRGFGQVIRGVLRDVVAQLTAAIVRIAILKTLLTIFGGGTGFLGSAVRGFAGANGVTRGFRAEGITVRPVQRLRLGELQYGLDISARRGVG